MVLEDLNEGKAHLQLLNEFLKLKIQELNKEQYMIQTPRCSVPSVIDKELIHGSKFIKEIRLCPPGDTYCLIFERNKANN